MEVSSVKVISWLKLHKNCKKKVEWKEMGMFRERNGSAKRESVFRERDEILELDCSDIQWSQK